MIKKYQKNVKQRPSPRTRKNSESCYIHNWLELKCPYYLHILIYIDLESVPFCIEKKWVYCMPLPDLPSKILCLTKFII